MGGSRRFTSNSDLIRVSDTAILQNIFDGGGTVSAWCYVDSIPANGRIFSKVSGSNGWSFYLRSATNSLSFFQYFSGTFGYREDSSSTPALNEWNHYAVTYNSSSVSNRATLYQNAQLYASSTGSTPNGTRESDVGIDFVIGNSDDESGSFLGNLAYVQAWDRALSVAEINESMRKPGSVLTNLVGYWPCIGADSTEPDFTGNGNSGAVTGTSISTNGPPIRSF